MFIYALVVFCDTVTTEKRRTMGLLNLFKGFHEENLFETEEWKNRERKLEEFNQYQKILKPISDKYLTGLQKLESDWSIIYNLKAYDDYRGEEYESDCKQNIELYKKMAQIEKKYNELPPSNAPAFKRLAMLYEKRGLFEASVSVCVDALQSGAWGDGMQARLARMIRKAKRMPTETESFLIDNDFSNNIDVASNVCNSDIKDRRIITPKNLDSMQRIEASDWYKNKIYKKYYFDYPEKPYISQDRELNANWMEQAELFPKQCIIPKEMMQRYSDGLLPGHVYMLYWLGKYTNKKIPAYFEYKYGIDFCKEKDFLVHNGYLKNNKPTEKGLEAMAVHNDVIEKHK